MDDEEAYHAELDEPCGSPKILSLGRYRSPSFGLGVHPDRPTR